MRKLFLCLSIIYISQLICAQAPQRIAYQSVIRNNNDLITQTLIGLKISILQTSETGSIVYQETQAVTTNENGLASFEIGTGTVSSGSFTGITWATGIFFVKIEADPTGGSNYTLEKIEQLVSVPYAYTAGNIIQPYTGGFRHFVGEDFGGGIVFSVYKGSDGLEHGLIVSKQELVAPWQITYSQTNANSSWNGQQNTTLMTNSPAKDYVTGLGSDWYIPSIDELQLLLTTSRILVDRALTEGGWPPLSTCGSGGYWSSSECIANQAYIVRVDDSNRIFSNNKNYLAIVRGVKSF